jgi:hypothetical protein
MVAAHEIFEKPFKVEFEFDEVETPRNYRDYPEGKDLPEQLKVWRVHADPLPDKNYGLVSGGYGFTDTPDCEYISAGVNSKGPGSVALGRQGNWFLWGFCASPSEMTESARRAFLNTIVYMKRFAGQPAIVTKPTKSRRWAYLYASLLAKDVEKDDDEFRSYLEKMFDPKILADAGDSKNVAKVLEANEGWLFWAENDKPASKPASRSAESRPSGPAQRIVIDEDAKSLGIANNDPAILDRSIGMLEKNDRPELARRILERYTDQKHGADAAAWRRWLEANRKGLYFTDTGGFRFRVKT